MTATLGTLLEKALPPGRALVERLMRERPHLARGDAEWLARHAAGLLLRRKASVEDVARAAIGFTPECLWCGSEFDEHDLDGAPSPICVVCTPEVLEIAFEYVHHPHFVAEAKTARHEGVFDENAARGAILMKRLDGSFERFACEREEQSMSTLGKILGERRASDGGFGGTLVVPLHEPLDAGVVEKLAALPEAARMAVIDARMAASCGPGRSREAARAYEVARAHGVEFQ